VREERPKLGEHYPKVRLIQDRLPIFLPSLGLSPHPSLARGGEKGLSPLPQLS